MEQKTLKDLTDEQVKEIVYLIYPYKKLLNGVEINVRYNPYQFSYSDDEKYIVAEWKIIKPPTKERQVRLWIYPNLNIDLDQYQINEYGFQLKDPKTLKLRNLYLIYQKFMEWGITPQIKNHEQ